MITATDLFCGAGGSSLGAEAVPGVQLAMAANHWATAVEVHQSHFPDAAHDLADISAADPRRYPVTDLLIACPECTNHSQARGVSRKRQDPSLWDSPDPAAERSRATMWDVVRFAEQIRYPAVIVENVVEATKWVGWRAWHLAMADLGYDHRVLSINSMHHRVPQSRDRIFVVFWRRGLHVDLDMRQQAWCPKCGEVGEVRQAWKNGRTVGRYRQQWEWRCTGCGAICAPVARPAADIIDWGLPCPRIGDRRRPLAAATRARILAGLQRYGWAPVVTAGAGLVYETTPGNRARSLTEPLAVQQASATHALATAPPFLVATGHHRDGASARIHDLGQPHPTVCASDDRLSMVAPFMVQVSHGGHQVGSRVRSVDDPTFTATASNVQGLVVPLRRNGRASDATEPAPTVTAGGNHHSLVLVNNPNNVARPVSAPLGTLTTSHNRHSLLMPYYGTGVARPTSEPAPTVTTRDRCAVIDLDALVDDCGFRMLEPHEIAAAMAFPAGYIPDTYTKRDRVKLAGNAVTPPVMTWIVERVRDALEAGA